MMESEIICLMMDEPVFVVSSACACPMVTSVLTAETSTWSTSPGTTEPARTSSAIIIASTSACVKSLFKSSSVLASRGTLSTPTASIIESEINFFIIKDGEVLIFFSCPMLISVLMVETGSASSPRNPKTSSMCPISSSDKRSV